jgi:hypothetical protein
MRKKMWILIRKIKKTQMDTKTSFRIWMNLRTLISYWRKNKVDIYELLFLFIYLFIYISN